MTPFGMLNVALVTISQILQGRRNVLKMRGNPIGGGDGCLNILGLYTTGKDDFGVQTLHF